MSETKTKHRIHIERVFAEELLDFPEDVYITDAEFKDGRLILDVLAGDDLGAAELDALYGNIEEDEEQVHLGMLEPRE